MIFGNAVNSLVLWNFFPMHMRGVTPTFTDAMHIILAINPFVLLSVVFGIAAFKGWFRSYSAATVLVLLVPALFSLSYVTAVAANQPTPGMGLTERVSQYGNQLWQALLALVLLRKGKQIMSQASAFKTPEGEAAFLASYDAILKLWAVPYEELDIPTRFGSTHVIVSGPKNAPPLVLLHGYMATSTMWTRNIADFSKEYRVYSIDVMGQPGKSIPAEPIRSAADYVLWLKTTLDALRLARVPLVGVSYGGWLACTYTVAKPERVDRLVLLSAGGLLPLTKQFSIRGMLMVLLPARFTVNSCMHWLGIAETQFLRLIYLGLKHFRMPPETARVMPTVFSDDELQSMRIPTLVLYGDHEVICDPVAALARARRLIPDVEGDLVPGCSHDMCFSQYRIVDARVLEFLKKTRADHQTETPNAA
jgi:pimeloyl-ACP methyl ester carboxylesterase